MKGGNWLTNLFGYGVEHAEPQTVELEDGFPFENMKFCGYAQEIMAIIQKNKPMSFTEFGPDYKNGSFIADFIINGKKVEKLHSCKKYTYKEVYNQSKKVNLVYHPRNKKAYLFFLKENMKDAYILWEIWDNNNNFGMIRNEENYDIIHTIIGILLGYKKKDIRAWFLMELEDEFDMDFDNIDQRKEFIEKPEFRKRRDEIAEDFENTWKKANEKLKEVEDTIEVPESWISQLKTLEPPKNTSKTAGHRKHLRKTRRR